MNDDASLITFSFPFVLLSPSVLQNLGYLDHDDFLLRVAKSPATILPWKKHQGDPRANTDGRPTLESLSSSSHLSLPLSWISSASPSSLSTFLLATKLTLVVLIPQVSHLIRPSLLRSTNELISPPSPPLSSSNLTFRPFPFLVRFQPPSSTLPFLPAPASKHQEWTIKPSASRSSGRRRESSQVPRLVRLKV